VSNRKPMKKVRKKKALRKKVPKRRIAKKAISNPDTPEDEALDLIERRLSDLLQRLEAGRAGVQASLDDLTNEVCAAGESLQEDVDQRREELQLQKEERDLVG
jgi:hypothetical protein